MGNSRPCLYADESDQIKREKLSIQDKEGILEGVKSLRRGEEIGYRT